MRKQDVCQLVDRVWQIRQVHKSEHVKPVQPESPGKYNCRHTRQEVKNKIICQIVRSDWIKGFVHSASLKEVKDNVYRHYNIKDEFKFP